MFTLEIQETFSAAHVLDSSYSKECQELHGHNWKVTVHVSTHCLNESNMVIDFKNLKEIFRKVISEFDHALIVPASLVKWCMDSKYLYIVKTDFMEMYVSKDAKTVITEGNSTAEELCFLIYEKFKDKIWSWGTVSKIEIEETENNKCVFVPENGGM